MNKYIVIFLLYLVASTQALNIPDNLHSDDQKVGPHRLHKREIENIHSIDIQNVKEKIKEACHEIKPRFDALIAEVAPSIHTKFQLDYLPAIRSMKDEVLPFFSAHVYPEIQKYFMFSLNIAEKLMEKAYRAYKLSNSTHLAIVSISDIINEVYEEVEPIIEMGRYMSATMMSSRQPRGKRDISEFPGNFLEGKIEEVHFIDIQMLNNKLQGTYESLKRVFEDISANIAPSIYEEFTLMYLPKLEEIRKDILPFFVAKVYPQIEKYSKFAGKIAEKLADKAYISYQLSNSTHINLVSISDVVDEVYNEMKPVFDLVRYLSTRMMMGNKRCRA